MTLFKKGERLLAFEGKAFLPRLFTGRDAAFRIYYSSKKVASKQIFNAISLLSVSQVMFYGSFLSDDIACGIYQKRRQ